MKKITFIFLLAILPLLGFGQNVNNPTFVDASEWIDGNAGPGQGIVSPADSHTADGSTSYKVVTNGATNTSIRNTNTAALAAGEYTFGYWVKGEAGVKSRPQIRDNGSATTINGVDYTIMNTGVWEYDEQTFIVSGTGTASLRIFIKTATEGASFQVDDVSFVYVPPTGNILTVNTVGGGSVAETLDKVSYNPADTETLTANPLTHWEFANWNGDLSGSTNPEDILMDSDKTVTANFVTEAGFDYDFLFNTDGESEGWIETNAAASVSGGSLTITPDADKFGKIELSNFPVPAANYQYLLVTLQNLSTNDDELKLVIDGGNITLDISVSDASMKSYEFDLTTLPAWTGDVSDVTLSFRDADNAAGAGRSSGTGDFIIDSIVFNNTTLATNNFDSVSFSVFPNPANSILNIKSATAISKVTLFDITGKQVLKNDSLIDNKLDISTLKTGLYIIRLEDINNNKTVKKFIKN